MMPHLSPENSLKEMSKQLIEELESIHTSTERDFTKANVLFDKLIAQLENPSKEDEIKADEIKKNIASLIEKYKIDVLCIVLDPNELSGDGVPDKDMLDSAKQKKEKFSKKGLAIIINFDPKKDSSKKEVFLENITSRLTYVCHWNQRAPVKTHPVSINLHTKLGPALSDMKLYPRLQRLTILGCQTAQMPDISHGLYMVKDISSSKSLPHSSYICEIKGDQSTLYFLDKDKQLLKISDLTIDSKETPFIKGKFWRLVKDPYKWIGSNNKVNQKMPELLLKIHMEMYNHNQNTLINDNYENIYVNQLLDSKEVSNYFSGKSSQSDSKLIKKQLVVLSHGFFNPSDLKGASNLTLSVEQAINEKREKKIEVKGYAMVIYPKGSSMVPLKSDIPGKTRKGIIYKRQT